MKILDHQQEALEFIQENGNTGGLLHYMGCGKTLTVLTLYNERLKTEPNLKLLVICPVNLIEDVWIGEIQKWYPHLKHFNLRNKRKKDAWMKRDANIFLINYEFFVRFKGDKISNHDVMCVLDESTRIKTHDINTTKCLLRLRDTFKYRMILTGTPAPNKEIEYWSQIRFLNDKLPKSFFAFRNIYFNLERGKEVITGYAPPELQKQGFKYVINESKQDELMGIIKSCCHYAKLDNLPLSTTQIRAVDLSKKEYAVYKQMRDDYISQIRDEEIVASNALTRIMKLRQITSGFAISDEGQIEWIQNEPSKYSELKRVISELGDRQLIIWCNFKAEINFLLGKLNNDENYPKNRAIKIDGSVKLKHRPGILQAFRDNKYQILISHPKCIAHGVTLVNCNVMLFYGLDYSLEYYQQAKARIHRHGQVNNCLNIHLIAKDSIDMLIYEVLKEKKNRTEILNRFMKG